MVGIAFELAGNEIWRKKAYIFVKKEKELGFSENWVLSSKINCMFKT